jgi:hypothetical protein
VHFTPLSSLFTVLPSIMSCFSALQRVSDIVDNARPCLYFANCIPGLLGNRRSASLTDHEVRFNIGHQLQNLETRMP